MKGKITDKENNFIDKLIQKGLHNAATAFSNFINKNVSIDIKRVEQHSYSKIVSSLKNDKYFLLTTDIIGEKLGKSLFVLEEHEVSALAKLCLPGKSAENPKMQEALLLEMDNILSASVITVFANELKLSIFGDVPKIEILNQKQIKALLNSETENTQQNLLPVLIKSSFKLDEDLNISPIFLWFLNDVFVESVIEKSSLAKSQA